jgi:glycosyltransferase involved in cell wall biosynthesis
LDYSYELIVVDNGSTDETQETVRKFAEILPIFSVKEPVAGLSRARNKGVEHASGRYIIWTDDDIVVSRDWLKSYASAFARLPEVIVFGGRIVPRLEGETPAWFADNLDALASLLGVRDFGDAELPLSSSQGRIPYGGNFAVRSVEQRHHLFDPELGVAPGRDRGGEETTVIAQLLSIGEGRWIPDSKVYHMIPPESQTINYLIRFYGRHGATDAHEGHYEDCQTFMGFPRFVLKRLVKQFILYKMSRVLSPSAIWLNHLKLYAYDRGIFYYYKTKLSSANK